MYANGLQKESGKDQLEGVLFDAFEQDGSYFVSVYVGPASAAVDKPTVGEVSRDTFNEIVGRNEAIISYREWGYVSFDVAAQLINRENGNVH